jgi:hypothetical protein
MSGRSLASLLYLLWAVCISGTVRAQTSTNSAASTNTPSQIAALTAEMNQAMTRVRQIVNQPVTRYARQPGMSVRIYSSGWFHEGATRPNFNTVDVRTTQELVYNKGGYVTSDLNPGVVFIGSQLEFNSMTKFFYTDRTLPKKRLTEPEMLEINRLYRVIGRCEHELDALQNPVKADAAAESENGSTNELAETGWTFSVSRVPRSRLMLAGGGIVAILFLYVVYKKWAR